MYCCTCAGPLQTTEKEGAFRELPCCGRIVCARCLRTNARFATYCPYCQIATEPPPATSEKRAHGPILPQGLREPPPYAPSSSVVDNIDNPPPYSPSSSSLSNIPEKSKTPLLHYLDHDRDSVASLALRYHITPAALRQANRLTADHLLAGRSVVIIPSTGSTGSDSDTNTTQESLSPVPVESEAATRRKTAIRRFMVACKESDYDVAELYLEQSAICMPESGEKVYDWTAAAAAYDADKRWEAEHPLDKGKKKEKKRRHLFRR